MNAFDTPKTKALAAFLKAESRTAENPGGRVVGLSIEGDDGVFIYTESAEWCDDNGSGTFRGDTETKAIAAFRARVQRNPAKVAEARKAAFLRTHAAPLPEYLTPARVAAAMESVSGPAGRASAIAPNATHASIHSADEESVCLCTVQRPRLIGGGHGLFEVSISDGRVVAYTSAVPTIAGALRLVAAYVGLALPADCDPAAELTHCKESFARDYEDDSAWATFRASSMTRAARWARRIELARIAAHAAAFAADTTDSVSFFGLETMAHLEAPEAEAPAAYPYGATRDPDAVPLKDEAPRRAVVDVTPTWEGVAGIIALGLECGTFEGRKLAREELTRMAKLADSAVAAAKAGPTEAARLAIRPALAVVWNEGYNARCDDENSNPENPTCNPYEGPARAAKPGPDALGEALDSARACLAAYPESEVTAAKGHKLRNVARDFRGELAGLVAALS